MTAAHRHVCTASKPSRDPQQAASMCPCLPMTALRRSIHSRAKRIPKPGRIPSFWADDPAASASYVLVLFAGSPPFDRPPSSHRYTQPTSTSQALRVYEPLGTLLTPAAAIHTHRTRKRPHEPRRFALHSRSYVTKSVSLTVPQTACQPVLAHRPRLPWGSPRSPATKVHGAVASHRPVPLPTGHPFLRGYPQSPPILSLQLDATGVPL
jgi:hypothetical protein